MAFKISVEKEKIGTFFLVGAWIIGTWIIIAFPFSINFPLLAYIGLGLNIVAVISFLVYLVRQKKIMLIYWLGNALVIWGICVAWIANYQGGEFVFYAILFPIILLVFPGIALTLFSLFKEKFSTKKWIRDLILSGFCGTVLAQFLIISSSVIRDKFPSKYTCPFVRTSHWDTLNCYLNAAKKEKDFTLCAKFFLGSDYYYNTSFREECYTEIAKLKKDKSICEKIPLLSHSRYWCYIEVAKITNDKSLCEEISHWRHEIEKERSLYSTNYFIEDFINDLDNIKKECYKALEKE